MTIQPFSPQTIEAQYGRLELDAPIYQPLDCPRLSITGRAGGDARCTIRVCDPLQRPYHEFQVDLTNNHALTSFTAAGQAGVHYIYLIFPGQERWSRYLNFEVRCESRIASGDPDIDGLFPFTHDHMRLGRREYNTPRGKFVGYISADTWHFDGIWLRDWIYGLPAYRHWERDMACGVDRFLEMQAENGMVPDGIERDGRTWRVGLESDVEYIMTLAVWQTWQATADAGWLRSALPHLERALGYVRSDAKHWDPQHNLVKRQHSCDTWDFDIDGATDHGNHRHVIATCDQSGYILAFEAMSRMYAALGEGQPAAEWAAYAAEYRQRAVDLLWDGVKFQHHAHLDAIDHAGFDETQQLAMGNTWAITRGMASPVQARAIVDEYRDRHARTGDAYPWWSLQPGYPNELGYFREEHRKQGGYANGGLMPWVGGELCLGAFGCGRETYAVTLLRQYADHLRRTGGAQVWYWPNGEAGFRTTNEVNYAGWGMAQWCSALFEGLAGIQDASAGFQEVRVSPRWAAAGVQQARVTSAYAVSNSCFAYEYSCDPAAQTLRLTFTGSGDQAAFHLLLPQGWEPQTLTLDGKPAQFACTTEDQSRYIDFAGALSGVSTAIISCQVH